MEDTSRYEILFDLPRGEYAKAEVGGIRTRTVRAGDALEVECYPLTRIGPAARAEATARRASRPCQDALNRRHAEAKIRRLIDANFTTEDWVVTLTYDYGAVEAWAGSRAEAEARWETLALPVDEEDARRDLNNFFRRVRTRLRQLGEDPAEFRDLYVLESTREGADWHKALYPHYHFHLVIHAPGLTRGEIERIWDRGFIRADNLSVRDSGPARLAAYMTKGRGGERVDAGGRRVRRWGRSKNLRDPEVTVSDRKVSKRRAALVAADVMANGVEIFEKLYPGYRCEEPPRVTYSDFVAGAYIFARMRRREAATCGGTRGCWPTPGYRRPDTRSCGTSAGSTGRCAGT